jgi:hypothetical protein
MEKNTTTTNQSPKKAEAQGKTQIRRMAAKHRLTIGYLGAPTSRYCILDEGPVVSEGQLPTTKAGLDSMFAKIPASRIALEVGTHSPWVSRHLRSLGHEAIVANAAGDTNHAEREQERSDRRAATGTAILAT